MEVTRRRFLAVSLSFVGTFLVGCGQSTVPSSQEGFVAHPASNKWPEPWWSRATPPVREAYQYALANPQVLQYMPCYCGCVQDGHASNRDCYIREFRSDGSVLLDPMSFG